MNEINPYLANPYEIILNAIQKSEFDKLLMKSPEYCFLQRFTPAPGNSDITSLLGVLYQYIGKYPKEELCQELTEGIYKVMDEYEGIDSIVSCILFETSHVYKNKIVLGLPLKEITMLFRKTVKVFQDRLVADKTEGGKGHENGRYNDLQRLSRIVVGYGGMAFCEGTEHDPIKPFF